jgi:phosphohistidine phosphatase
MHAMKNLLLLRHAKSSWKEADLEDYDRPLNKRGKRDAPRIGQLLRDERLVPDQIVSSSAKRARRTAEHVAQASGFRGETRLTNELYEAAPEQMLAVIKQTPQVHERLLLVGHNPGLEELLELLTGECRPLTTAALAWIELEIDAWADLAPGAASRLVSLWQPRELD